MATKKVMFFKDSIAAALIVISENEKSAHILNKIEHDE